jgi:hypothetical protein
VRIIEARLWIITPMKCRRLRILPLSMLLLSPQLDASASAETLDCKPGTRPAAKYWGELQLDVDRSDKSVTIQGEKRPGTVVRIKDGAYGPVRQETFTTPVKQFVRFRPGVIIAGWKMGTVIRYTGWATLSERGDDTTCVWRSVWKVKGYN